MLVELSAVSKRFGDRLAVDRLDLAVAGGHPQPQPPRRRRSILANLFAAFL